MTPYIAPAEQAAFGIPSATPAQLSLASRLFDAHIGRPEGLLWSPDFAGAPAYMTNATPTLSFANIAIPAGQNIAVTLPGMFGFQNVGDVVTLDKNTPTLTETCIIAAASGNTITLSNVQLAHAGIVDFGLTIAEEVKGRVRLSRWPVASVISASGRYGFDEEMRRISSGFDDFEALLVTNYGQNSVSGWSPLDLSRWDINGVTGSIRFPGYGCENVRVRYIAGYQAAPDIVKQCVANIVKALPDANTPNGVKTFKEGDAMYTLFDNSLIDPDTRAMAQPFKTLRI